MYQVTDADETAQRLTDWTTE